MRSRSVRKNTWKKDALLVVAGVGLLAAQPNPLEGQTCGSDKNHYHEGADHCDSGQAGCTVVCPE